LLDHDAQQGVCNIEMNDCSNHNREFSRLNSVDEANLVSLSRIVTFHADGLQTACRRPADGLQTAYREAPTEPRASIVNQLQPELLKFVLLLRPILLDSTQD
jgi:hypothetical protein